MGSPSREPGLPLLRLAQGQRDAAVASIRRALAEATDDQVLARLLEPAVEIALATGDVPDARAAADRLATLSESFEAPLLRAMATRAEGFVRLAEGDVQGALASLRRAWEAWRDLDAPTRRLVSGRGQPMPAASSATMTAPRWRPRRRAGCSSDSARPWISSDCRRGPIAARSRGG